MQICPNTSPSTSPNTSPDASLDTHVPAAVIAPEDPGYDAAQDQRRIAELDDEIAELSAHIDAATYRLLKAISEFDRRLGWADAGCVSCALSCDAPVVELIEDDRGQPLDVGRKTRRIGAALFRALKTRDGTCQFPGCEATARLTPHHISHWAAGGTTDKDNLVMLCGAHHWAVHEGGFAVHGRAPDELTFFTRGGIELKACCVPPPLSPDPLAALKAPHALQGLSISPDSNAITWQGERLDMDMDMDALLP